MLSIHVVFIGSKRLRTAIWSVQFLYPRSRRFEQFADEKTGQTRGYMSFQVSGAKESGMANVFLTQVFEQYRILFYSPILKSLRFRHRPMAGRSLDFISIALDLVCRRNA
jgi:hypothetical protein